MRADYLLAAGVPPCRLTEAAKSLLQHRPTGMALPVLGERPTEQIFPAWSGNTTAARLREVEPIVPSGCPMRSDRRDSRRNLVD